MSATVSRSGSYSPSLEKFEYTNLQQACKKGDIHEVQMLIDSRCDINIGPDPALHIALRRKHTVIAIMLLQAAADFELKDSRNDFPIHIASSLGLLDVVQVLCALGCSVEVVNAKGLYPLHLASRNGHTNIVRCLCAAGCNIDIRNSDNIRADITALKYGHNDIADLLDKLRASGQRDVYARQLIPTTKPLSRLTLRLLGHCGVGKTALIKSLGAGLFSSLFRRSSSLQSNKSRPSSPINSQIEMDVTSRQNSLTFEVSTNYQSTKGINVQNLDVTNVGDVTIWEFSGQESYFPVYHHFLYPNQHCLTGILFSLEESFVIQLQQVCFWINFLMARQIADLVPGEYGKILLIATHVDTTRAVRNPQGEWICPDAQKILESVYKLIPHVLNVCPTVLVLDCNVPAAYPIKQLKSILSAIKQEYMQAMTLMNSYRCKNGMYYNLIWESSLQQSVGMGTGLLEASLLWLATLRKEREFFPVITRNEFSELLRGQLNLLASDEHIRDLLQHLHNFGEVFYVCDLVIISVNWLCSDLLGELLSSQFISHTRITGVYSPDDFQAVFNCCDALELLQLLEALHLCIQCDVEGDVEYEFPCYNQTETLPGLWDSGHPIYRMTGACYGGVRLCLPTGITYMLTSVFSHVQVELRRATSQHLSIDSDTDLYQWFQGSKLCAGALESLITLNTNESGKQVIEVKVRGPRDTAQSCFYFLTGIVDIIEQAIFMICPGLLLEHHIMSPQQLRIHCAEPYCYPQNIIVEAILNSESTVDISLNNPETDKQETIVQLLLFDCEALLNEIQWGCTLSISRLSGPIRLKLCGLLDPPEPYGCDWCLLGLRLGVEQERIATFESAHLSHTMRILTLADCTIGALVTNLHDLGREDAVDVILRSTPLYRIAVPADVADSSNVS